MGAATHRTTGSPAVSDAAEVSRPRVPLEAARRRRPLRERQPVNLRVVANVHGKALPKKEAFDFTCVRIFEREQAQVISEQLRLGRIAHSHFHDHRRYLPPTFAKSDQCTTHRPRMLTKNLLTRFGVQYAT